jgi:adenylylsulfate reductase, subunit A
MADGKFVGEQNGHCFVNLDCDKQSRKCTCFKRKHVDLVNKFKMFKPATPH